MTNTKHRNRHGRIGTKGPRKPLTGSQVHKKVRRALTNPHHQNEYGVAQEKKRDRRRIFENRRMLRRHDRVRPSYDPFAGLPPLSRIIKEVDMKSAMEGATLRMGSDETETKPSSPELLAQEAMARGEAVATAITDDLNGNAVWLSTAQAAEAIGMGVTYVKQHAEELGGEKHNLRWRFERRTLMDRWGNRA